MDLKEGFVLMGEVVLEGGVYFIMVRYFYVCFKVWGFDGEGVGLGLLWFSGVIRIYMLGLEFIRFFDYVIN